MMPPLVLGPAARGASASHLVARTVAGAPTHRGKGSEAGSGPGLPGPSATASLLCWAIAPHPESGRRRFRTAVRSPSRFMAPPR